MTVGVKKVQNHYDNIAEVYDHQYDYNRGKVYYSHICEGVMEHLPKGGFLLDLGCGTGLFMQRYLRLGGRAAGLDISGGMLKKAQDRCSGCDVTVGNAEMLPFCDNTFDCISSLLAFSYLQKPEDALGEVFRVLKPGGSISICTLGRNVFTSMVPVIYRIGEKLHFRRVGMGTFSEHYYTEDEMYEIFEKAGFEDVVVKRRSFAHVDLNEHIFDVTRKAEPFVEDKMPYLAFNICASGIKPKR